jgi:hypothetical protein
MTKVKRRFVWMPVLLLVVALAARKILVEYSHARVREYWAEDPNVTLKLDSICPSWSYYLYICYDVEGDSELTKAFWRLKGNQVDVEK